MRIGDLAPNAAVNQAVPWYQALVTSLSQAASAYVTVDQQKSLNQINLERARNNLPPLDSTQYQTGLSLGLGGSTQNTLITVAAIGGGIWLLTSIIGGRRSRR